MTSLEDIPTVELKRMLAETVRKSGIDIQSILAEHEPEDGGGDDGPGARTTH